VCRGQQVLDTQELDRRNRIGASAECCTGSYPTAAKSGCGLAVKMSESNASDEMRALLGRTPKTVLAEWAGLNR